MTTMVAEVYDALREAGASEEKARRAAEALAGHDERFTRLDGRIAAVEGRMTALEGRMAAIEARLATMQWVIALVCALQIAILVKLFVHA